MLKKYSMKSTVSKMPEKKRIFISHSKIKFNPSFEKILNESVELVFIPTIETVPLPLGAEEKTKIKYFNDYDYLIFTSANAVKYFIANVGKKNFIPASNLLIAATGEKTALELTKLGIKVKIIPAQFSAGGLLEVLPVKLAGKKFLIPGSKISRATLRNGLARRGAIVDFVPVYDTKTREKAKKELEKFSGKKFDAFVFTSPSSIKGFLEILKIENPADYFSSAIIVPIGDVTAESLKNKGLTPSAIPESFTVNAALELAANLIMPSNKLMKN